MKTKSQSVALLTPYDGGNLGDSAIQEAVIANLRICDPNLQVCGITLNPEKTSVRHQIPCYPLAARSRAHYQIGQEEASEIDGERARQEASASVNLSKRLRGMARAVPFLRWLKVLADEIQHACRSYFLLRNVDVLVIAGGGQLDDEWGGSWGHPYSLMKWAVLARAAGSPVVFLSVGACRIKSRLTRVFLRAALALACYRSYRDEGSRRLALGITSRAEGPVVPDLAFSLQGRRPKTGLEQELGRPRIGVSPIAYCHPGLWPTKDSAQYQRYVAELASFVSKSLRGGVSVCLFSSSPPDDQIFPDIYTHLDPSIDSIARARLSSSSVKTLDGLFDVLESVDIVVASRLHGLLLSFIAGKPAIAISYDRKVECLMEDLGQIPYCIDIRSFSADDLLSSLERLRANHDDILSAIAAACRRYDDALQQQYRMIMQLLASRSSPLLQNHSRASFETKS